MLQHGEALKAKDSVANQIKEYVLSYLTVSDCAEQTAPNTTNLELGVPQLSTTLQIGLLISCSLWKVSFLTNQCGEVVQAPQIAERPAFQERSRLANICYGVCCGIVQWGAI